MLTRFSTLFATTILVAALLHLTQGRVELTRLAVGVILGAVVVVIMREWK